MHKIEKVFELKNRQVYIIHPFPRRLKLGKSLQTCFVNFFHLSWCFKREKSIFWKVSFLQNKNWLHMQGFVFKTVRLVRIFLLISAITKSFVFFLGKLICKSNRKHRKLFSRIGIAWYKHLRGWENFLKVMQALDFVLGLHNCLKFSQPVSCLYHVYIRLYKHRKCFLLLKSFSGNMKVVAISF